MLVGLSGTAAPPIAYNSGSVMAAVLATKNQIALSDLDRRLA